MRTHLLTVSLLVVVSTATGCARARAVPPDSAATPTRRLGVAGNCAANAGEMIPAAAGAVVDRNGDGYVCTRIVRSIAGDTARVTVDNDAASTERVVDGNLYRRM